MPRPAAHLANLDLNLLVALRELLRERSVTRAAERLGVTQPAASAALVAGTDRIALMQERLAARLADRTDLRVAECPGHLEPIAEALWWHRQYQDDPAHAWLRRLVAGVAATAR